MAENSILNHTKVWINEVISKVTLWVGETMQKPRAMEAQEPSLRAGCTVMTGNAENGNVLRRPFTANPL